MIDRRSADRQRKLDEVCRAVIAKFVGREVTPTIAAEAAGCLRAALDDAVRAGTYVLPDGLCLDRVEVGDDLRFKVFFTRRRG